MECHSQPVDYWVVHQQRPNKQVQQESLVVPQPGILLSRNRQVANDQIPDDVRLEVVNLKVVAYLGVRFQLVELRQALVREQFGQGLFEQDLKGLLQEQLIDGWLQHSQYHFLDYELVGASGVSSLRNRLA